MIDTGVAFRPVLAKKVQFTQVGLERELLQAQRRANAAVFRGRKAVCLTGAKRLMEGVEAGDIEGLSLDYMALPEVSFRSVIL